MESLAENHRRRSDRPGTAGELVDRLAKQTESLDIQQETKTTFWDKWLFFLTLVGLLGGEYWCVRGNVGAWCSGPGIAAVRLRRKNAVLA